MEARVLASPSRRNFLTATTAIGGGLLLGFGLPAPGAKQGVRGVVVGVLCGSASARPG
jgi:hypothetical protein